MPKNKNVSDFEKGKKALCDNMNFATAEAFKMLRTKLNLTIPENENGRNCKIIGITSAMRGEGKTQTAINLTYTFAQSNNKVCLIEADMRLPNIAARIGLPANNPGLSNLLTGQTGGKGVIQTYKSEKGISFNVITAGDIPPMPSELLETSNMKSTMTALSNTYDIIIVDLPPVSAVTDAITISPMLNGMIVVIRKDRCNKGMLQDTMNQLHLAEVKLLGCVFVGSHLSGGNYYKKNSGYYYYYQHSDSKKKGK